MSILIIGSDHHNTLGVVESLGEKGVKPDVIVTTRSHTEKSFVLKSKYVARGYICDAANIVPFLTNEYEPNDTEKTIIITTNDDVASSIDEYYDCLCNRFILPGTGKQSELKYWMNKANMIELAQKVGLNVPKTAQIKKGEKLGVFVFPCMTKSISSLEGGKSNIHICKNLDELNEVLGSQKKYPEVQVQQFIDKAFEFQFLGYSLGGGDEIIIPGRTHIDRPKGYDNTFFLSYLQIEDEFKETLEKAKEFIRHTHYSGPFSIEFLHDKKGVNYFLEMNFRNDGNAICMTASGTNTPYIWYLYNTGGDYKKELAESSFKPVTLMPEEPYFFNMLRREVSFGEWLRNMRNTTQFATYFKNDKKPFKVYVRMEMKKYISKYMNKLFTRVWEPVFIVPKQGANVLDGKWEYKYLKNKPKDRCFADPFILDVTDSEIILLVEEIRTKYPTGRIAKLIIDKKSLSIKDEIVLLDLETHLSFPTILRKGEDIFVYPENADSGALTLYRYHQDEERFEFVEQLSDRPLSDAVIFDGFDKPCVLATRKPKSNGNETEFYEAEDVLGKYHYVSSVSFSDKIGRSAGDIFEHEGKLIRPAQVNNRDYGEALCFQELKKSSNGYDLTEINRVKTPRYATGLHTFNGHKGIYVVDIRKAVHPWIYFPARWIYRLFKIKK